MKKAFLILMLAISLAVPSGVGAESFTRSYTTPTRVEGVARPVISLDGEWKFRFSPKSKWTNITVPGEPVMQGYAIEHDKPFFYKKSFLLPADAAGKRAILRFDGVYSEARLSVNGKFVRQHNGGFTRWETDITPFVHPGKNNVIELEVIDRLNEISYASGYAHHPVGGILRNVSLLLLPESHLHNLAVETRLDSAYRDAQLRFSFNFSGPARDDKALLSLKDASGREIARKEVAISASGSHTASINVNNPLKWDAEHPNLYSLEVSQLRGGKEVARHTLPVGFREIKVVKDRLLVNGTPVKFRGACRHDLHPTLGRSTTREMDSLDVRLFKEANMNFVRTSHYPPTESFLEFCDRYGIYVECETAVCFVDTHRQKNYAPGNSASDSLFTDQYLSQCREMLGSFRSHPSVTIWSIGNESVYGSNFQKSYDLVKASDPTRPVIFSYPGSANENKAEIFDILSMHYQDVNGNLWQWGMNTSNFQGHGIPAIFDEWAHPACYTYETLQHDPNIREFWGQSLDKMWSGLYEAPGGLGGAIWGYVDETFSVPKLKMGTPFWKEFAHTAKPEGFRGDCVGYGEWGIVDVWRRPKPEFWSTKKAYSPVRLLTDRTIPFIPGQDIMLTVYNRFDHTNLNELQATYTYKGRTGALALDSIVPHQKGMLVIPANAWEEGETVDVQFLNPDGSLVDAYTLTLGSRKIDWPAGLPGGNLTVEEHGNTLVVAGNGFRIPFSKQTGLIDDATVGRDTVIEGGPFLNLFINLNHLSGAEVRKTANRIITSPADWQLESFTWRKDGSDVFVTTGGKYGDIAVVYDIRITPSGELGISYRVDGAPNGYVRETGISLRIPSAMDRLDWQREGYWSNYPEGAFAGNRGSAPLYSSRQAAYGEAPVQPWQADTREYYYWADRGANTDTPLTRMAKGMKENVYTYTLERTSSESGLSVISKDASVACRLDKPDGNGLYLYADNRWDYPEIAWGNYCKTLEALPCYGSITLQLK